MHKYVAHPVAEVSVSESTMLAIMGQMSRAVLERYSHIRSRRSTRRLGADDTSENSKAGGGLYKIHYTREGLHNSVALSY